MLSSSCRGVGLALILLSGGLGAGIDPSVAQPLTQLGMRARIEQRLTLPQEICPGFDGEAELPAQLTHTEE